TLLGELSIVERLVGGFEIGAAVLAIRIEEQGVEPAVEIVMMRDVALRATARIELLQAAVKIADEPLRPGPQRRPAVASLRQHDAKYVGNRAAFDDDAAVHIGFAEAQFGVDENAALRGTR